MKKTISIIISVLVMISFSAMALSGCQPDKKPQITAKQFTPLTYYPVGSDALVLELENYFENLTANANFTATHGSVQGSTLTIGFETAGVFEVEVTASADGRGQAVLKFTLDVYQEPQPEELFADFNEVAKDYAAASYRLNKAVRDNYWLETALFAYHYYPNINSPTGDYSAAFLWPYTEMVAANWRMATLAPGSREMMDFYRSTLKGFEYYRGFREDYLAYPAVRATQIGMAGNDTYYDDNVWVARELLNAYEVLGEQEYLDKAIGVCEYIWSGWAKDEIGGIYWLEQRRESRNTCSNAPAALLFGRMYQTTGDESYLTRAIQIYDFCVEWLRDPSEGTYWDNVRNNGTIDKAKYTYNTGSMIAAGIKLYEITGEETYLQDAQFSAQGGYSYFFNNVSGRNFRGITRGGNPWFNLLLLDGFIELYKHDQSAYTYIREYRRNLDYAYASNVNDMHLMHPNWHSGSKPSPDTRLNILDMSGNAENMGLIAYFYQHIYQGPIPLASGDKLI